MKKLLKKTDKSDSEESKDLDPKAAIDDIISDISKASFSKQIIMGASAGWITGMLAMRMGKFVAMAVGSGIIMLEVASEFGYAHINWDKVSKKLDKAADKLEEQITGHEPSLMDKVERFVDRKVHKIEAKLAPNTQKRRWDRFNAFMTSFLAGFVLGLAMF